MDMDRAAVLNRFLLRPLCLEGFQWEQPHRGSSVGAIARRGEEAIRKVIETHWHLVLELYSDQPIYDAEGAEHILLSKYFTIVQRRSKLKGNKRWLEAMQ
jgi:hypothetical protein